MFASSNLDNQVQIMPPEDLEGALLLFLRYSYFIQRFNLSFLSRKIMFVDMANETPFRLLKSKSLCF